MCPSVGDEPERPPRLTVSSGIAAVDTLHSDSLREALTAIPGTIVPVRGMAWAVRIGPERACSLAHLAQRFELACGAESRRTLDQLTAKRDPARPVVELIERDELRLSVLDEPSLGVEALRSIPGSAAQAGAGRLEVPLTRWTAGAIAECVEAHALRLSPPAELALREALATPTAEEVTLSHSDAAGVTIGDSDAGGVTMLQSAAHVVLTAGDRDDLARSFARLPEVRTINREARRWLLPATPQGARALRELLASDGPLTLDDVSARWLQEAPRWIARAEIDVTGGEPRIALTTRWGEPPPTLVELDGSTTSIAGIMAPLSAANIRVIAALAKSESELTVTGEVDRVIAWLAAHPDEATIPGAELDIQIGDPARFVVEPVWNPEIEAAFLAQEAHLLRFHRITSPEASELPADAWPTDELARFIRVHRARCTPAAGARLERALSEESDEQRLIALSRGTDAELVVDGLAGELMPFQRAGVVYALERRRVFLADEQGLGKTVQALATLQADGAYPAIVVCPASLKLNWLREARRWLPQRTAREVSGRASRELDGADILVVNYEVIGDHLDALDALAPRALVLDESHYIKSPGAVRTRAVLELAGRLGPNALRLALTGTPVVNRPAELAPQLRVLGRLDEYGSARSFERLYSSGNARRRLHEQLRASCYLRRRKQDVLTQLPDKRRAVVTVPLTNEPEYRQAERDFIHWLRAQVQAGTGKLPDSARGIALTRLAALRRLAARGKLRAALSWIEDFRASEERLLVFAHHRDIQDAVSERFPDSARIVGADDIETREANVRRFQADDGPGLCVASLEVASHGFTLTAAANVAFLELAWTPAKHDQAEDRLHRIGQQRAVTAWYLLAAGTIDERIAALLQDKRQVVDSLTDGGEAVSGTLLSSLLDEYAGGSD
jgi:SWI/SNF-related matrix-associated actin-dependent regulator 1 of chromatin subfamily A